MNSRGVKRASASKPTVGTITRTFHEVEALSRFHLTRLNIIIKPFFIVLVDDQTRLRQKRFILLTKGHVLVVLLLMTDVFNQPVLVWQRMGECSVTVLPMGK